MNRNFSLHIYLVYDITNVGDFPLARYVRYACMHIVIFRDEMGCSGPKSLIASVGCNIRHVFGEGGIRNNGNTVNIGVCTQIDCTGVGL